jgi:hypothetical protein
MKKIYSSRLQDFLNENGVYPVDYDDTGAEYYKETAQFLSLLESYFIRTKIFSKNF